MGKVVAARVCVNNQGVEYAMFIYYDNHPLPPDAKPISAYHSSKIEEVLEVMRDKPLESRIKSLDDATIEEWDEGRMDNIGRNGNDGIAYRSKYHREIKPGVWVDVYDVLNAFGVKCHALAHAIKKLLMPGERGAKGYKQDCEEAIQSIKRSIDEHV